MAGAIGTAVTQPLPTVNEAGPDWASALLTWCTEIQARLAAIIDSASITLTTGDVIHGSRNGQLGAAAAKGSSGATWTPASGSNSAYYLATGASDIVEWALPLERNQRFTGARVTGRSTGSAWSCKAWLHNTSAGTRSQLGNTMTSGTSTSIEELTFTGITATTLADNQYISLEWTSGAANTRALACEYTYDRTVST